MGNRAASACLSCLPKPKDSLPVPGNVPSPSDPLIFSSMPTPPKSDSLALDSTSTNTSNSIEEESQEALDKDSILKLIDDKFEMFITEAKKEMQSDGYEKLVDKEGCLVYGRDDKDGYLLKSTWNITYSPKAFLDFLGDNDKRKTWDKNIADAKKICEISSEVSVHYILYKRLLTLAARDLVIVSKRVDTEEGCIEVSTSISLPQFPSKNSLIRAQLHIGGYYVVPIEKDEFGNTARVVSISSGDIGGKLPKQMIKKMSAMTVPKFAKNVKDAMGKGISSDGIS
jgi:hypothetical protein